MSPPPPHAHVDLWWFPTCGPGAPGGAALDALCGDERRRADRFATGEMRRRWSAARAGLRAVLAHHLGADPAALRFGAGHRGKPFLVEGAGLRFNLSHGGELAVVGVARGREVGVDVEPVERRIRDAEAIARRYFSQPEQAYVLDGPPAEISRRFLRVWTRKEAVVKLTGDGLAATLSAVEVGWPGSPPPRPLRVEDSSGARWSLRVVDASPGAGHLAALAAEGVGWRLRVRRWPPEAVPGTGAG